MQQGDLRPTIIGGWQVSGEVPTISVIAAPSPGPAASRPGGTIRRGDARRRAGRLAMVHTLVYRDVYESANPPHEHRARLGFGSRGVPFDGNPDKAPAGAAGTAGPD